MNIFKRTLFLALLAIGLIACSDDDGGGDKSTIDQAEFLRNSSKIISEAWLDLETTAIEFEDLANGFKNASNNSISQNQIQELRAQLKKTWKSWQNASTYEFGAVAPFSLKSNLNIYRTDTAKIEQSKRDKNYDFAQLSLKDAKGFPALDYLLNMAEESVTVTIFSSDSARRVYLERVVNDLTSRIKEVRTSWENDRANFESNKGTDVGSSTGMLVNALNLHFEKYFRNNKIGIPLGVRSSGIPQTDFVEAFYASYSLELAKENFTALKNFYYGIDATNVNGFGLEDYLIALDAADLNQRIKDQITNIEIKLNDLSDPLALQIANDANKVQEAYNEIQKLIILWKVDMPSRMGILITFQDNDGD